MIVKIPTTSLADYSMDNFIMRASKMIIVFIICIF